MTLGLNGFSRVSLRLSVVVLALVGYMDTARAQNTLQFSPASFTFNFQMGGATPDAKILNVTSTGASVVVTPSATTAIGGPWLMVAPASLPTPAAFNVSVNPAGLPPATYMGTISLSSPGSGAAPVPVSVTLVVAAAPALILSQTNLQFFYQTGTPVPAQATVTVASSSTPLNYTAVGTTSSGIPWLVVGQSSGVTPSVLTIGANPTGLPTNVYTGMVTVSAPGASNSPQIINVTFSVSPNPLLMPSATAVGFSFQLNGANPANQTINLNSTGAALPFTATYIPTTGGNFLTVTPSGTTTPGTLTLAANPAGLTPGTYTGQIAIASIGAPNGTLAIPVSFTVGNNPLLTFTQPSANFNFQIGTAPPPAQIITLGSTGAPLTFTAVTSTTTGGNFLTATPSGTTTPGTLTLTANPAGLPTGTYTGSVTVTPAGSTPQTIPVSLTVGSTPLVNINPAALMFTASQIGGPPPFQNVALTSTSDPLPFTLTTSTNPPGAWLVVTPPTGGTAPGNLSVGVNQAGLAIGTYSGSIVVTAGGQMQTIPVTLTVNSGITLNVPLTPLMFTQITGGQAPAVQTVAVTSTNANIPITATAATASGGSWLMVTSTAGTPGSVTVSVNGGVLMPGTYMGTITVTGTNASNGPQVIPVTLTVTAQPAAPVLSFTPSVPLTLTGVMGGPNPANVSIAIAGSGGAAVPFTVAATIPAGGVSFLTVTPASGTTPGTLAIAFNTVGLMAGTYTGTVTVTPTAAAPAGTAPLSIPVTLTVTPPVIPTPVLTSVQNAASGIAGTIAPGEIVTIFGTNIGPATPVGLRLTAAGNVDTNLGNTRVLFDGIPAPLTYVSATQVNAVVPYEMAGRVSTRIQIEVSGMRSTGTDVRVVDAVPGIFTQNSSGSGAGSILNQENSVNTPATPATRNSIVQIFATGEGQDAPAGVTGTVNAPVLRPSVLPITATVAGQPAQVTYGGAAPNFVAGVLQVNVKIPLDNVPSGPVNVVITVGSGPNAPSSQANVTVFIQ